MARLLTRMARNEAFDFLSGCFPAVVLLTTPVILTCIIYLPYVDSRWGTGVAGKTSLTSDALDNGYKLLLSKVFDLEFVQKLGFANCDLSFTRAISDLGVFGRMVALELPFLTLFSIFGVVTVQSATLQTSTSLLQKETTSWQQYVQGPDSRIVKPLAVLSGSVTGQVTNADSLLASGGASAKFVAPETIAAPRTWPSGTTANASSFHAPSQGGDGSARTYSPGNAIDGNTATFWNDDTVAAYPDILTIISPSAVSLDGVTILSQLDGVIVDVTVQYLRADGTWQSGGTVTGNRATLFKVPFSSNVTTTMVKITVTKDQSTSSGEFSRITEVYPGLYDPPSAPSLVVDFGKVVVGFLNIAFSGASTNKPGIQLAFSETTEYLTTKSDFTRSQSGNTITSGTDQIAVGSSPYTWQDNYGCADGKKVCDDGLHGFRYVRITLNALPEDSPDTSAFGTVNIDAVWLNFTGFLGTANSYSGWFECSDVDLNKYWYDAAYTNELCTDTFRKNDTDPRNAYSTTLDGKLVFLDGAKRDRDPYIGDIAISGRTVFLTHSSASIASKNVLSDLANHQRSDGWIPPASISNYQLPLFDYPLCWVCASYDLITYTSDLEYARTYYPNLLLVLDTYYVSATDPNTNLLNKNIGGNSDYGDYAFLPRKGTITYYNALYVLALKNAAKIATALNKTADTARWLARAQRVSEAVNAKLWDTSVGAYWDSLETKITHGQDGNGLAVVSGIANSTRATSLLSYWSTLALPYGNPFFDNDALSGGFSTRVYAFVSYYELQARFMAGQGDSAVEEIKRLYGWMSTHDPGVTFWEGIGAGGSMYEGGFTSAAHGWSTGVLPALTNFVLGVVPTGLGFGTWSVKPMPVGGVKWAKGVVPTPMGEISVDWSTDVGFSMTILVPKGTAGVVSVPVAGGGKTGNVSVNGETVWAKGVGTKYNAEYTSDGYVAMDITDAESYLFAVSS